MTPDLTLDNNATKIRIRLITDIDYVTLRKRYVCAFKNGILDNVCYDMLGNDGRLDQVVVCAMK